MKYISLFLTTIVLILGISVSLPGAHGVTCGSLLSVAPAAAQAGPDHDSILTALIGMKRDINKMIPLVSRHRAASITVGEEAVPLTAEQLSQLLTRYNTLKTSLAAKYQQLP
ncbi:MAG: hypothetical protein OEZ04_02540 [Nitrospinota bacterium]|nr:hypothetical protein [Nitrospinota bacterium]